MHSHVQESKVYTHKKNNNISSYTVLHILLSYLWLTFRDEYNPLMHNYAGSDFTFIDISPRPSANDPLTGGDTLGARCGELLNQPNMVQCIVRPPLPPLVDGDLGPEGPNYILTLWSMPGITLQELSLLHTH